MMYLVMAALEMLAMWSTKLPHYSVIIQSWSICGEKQSSISTLPPGSALIGHQGALLEGKKCYFSAACGPIGLKLGRFAEGRGLQRLWWHLAAGLQRDGDCSDCGAI